MESRLKGTQWETWIQPDYEPDLDDFDYDLNDDSGTLHVIPANDVARHSLSHDCWCVPEIEWEADELVYLHNAMDGRDRKPH